MLKEEVGVVVVKGVAFLNQRKIIIDPHLGVSKGNDINEILNPFGSLEKMKPLPQFRP